MILQLEKYHILTVFEQTSTIFEETPYFLIVKNGDYNVKVANLDYPNKIEIYGFFPPKLPGIKFIPDYSNYGKFLAEFDMEQPAEYLIELLRIILHLLPDLRHVDNWAKVTAPHMLIKPMINDLINSMYKNITASYNNHRTKVLLGKLFQKPASMNEAFEKLAEARKEIRDPSSNINIPVLDFGLEGDTDESYLFSQLDIDTSNFKTHIPSGDTKDTAPDLPPVPNPNKTRNGKGGIIK